PLWIQKLQLPTTVPFDYPSGGNTTLVGTTGQWLLPALHVSYPKSPELKGFDALGNSPRGTYLQLDTTRMWRLPAGTPLSTPRPARPTARSQDDRRRLLPELRPDQPAGRDRARREPVVRPLGRGVRLRAQARGDQGQDAQAGRLRR